MQVVLEQLPPEVQAAMDEHNRDAMRVFVNYVRCYVAGLPEQAQEVLPLSGVRVPASPAGAHQHN